MLIGYMFSSEPFCLIGRLHTGHFSILGLKSPFGWSNINIQFPWSGKKADKRWFPISWPHATALSGGGGNLVLGEGVRWGSGLLSVALISFRDTQQGPPKYQGFLLHFEVFRASQVLQNCLGWFVGFLLWLLPLDLPFPGSVTGNFLLLRLGR